LITVVPAFSRSPESLSYMEFDTHTGTPPSASDIATTPEKSTST